MGQGGARATSLGILALFEFTGTRGGPARAEVPHSTLKKETLILDAELGSDLALPPMPPPPIAEDDFDEAWYLARHADIREAVRAGAIASGYLHFVKFGKGEGRAYRVCANNPPSALTLRNPGFRHRFYRCLENGQLPRMDSALSVDDYLATHFRKMELVRE